MFISLNKYCQLYLIWKILICNYLLLLFVFLLSSCITGERNDNSTFSKALRSINGEPVVPRKANRIIIPYFYNFTTVSSITDKITLKVRELISMDGRLAVVSDNKDADLRLIGKIVKYHLQPVQYGNFGQPVRKRLRILATIKLVDIKNNREIFFEKDIQSFEIFSDQIPPIVDEAVVRDRVLDNMARRISIKILTGWYTDLMSPIEKGKK